MVTVSQLAKRCKLSRGTLLYYESIGLLQPARASGSNYRRYSAQDQQRLEQICFYRGAGLKLEDIKRILVEPGRADGNLTAILEGRLRELAREIDTLRGQQKVILSLLQNQDTVRRWKVITKDKWVSIMKGSGFSEEEMKRWHVEFERSAPGEHQEFLEFLHIPADEISRIREWSRAPQA